MTESIRLAKRLAEQLTCSRSEAEQYIEGGWVEVDGQLVEEAGYRIAASQQVTLLPQASLTAVAPITILLHKKAGESIETALQNITPENRAADDRSGIRFLKKHVTDLKLTSPLETLAGGLLVLTQDWKISRKLIDDSARIEQEYIAEVSGDLAPDGLGLLKHGLSFNGKALPPISVSWQNETRLRFALKNAQPFQIPAMCEKVGLQVQTLKRIRIGRISMSSLQQGQWRYLMGYERF